MTTALRAPRPLGDTETGPGPGVQPASAGEFCSIDAGELLRLRARLGERPEYRSDAPSLTLFAAQAVLAALADEGLLPAGHERQPFLLSDPWGGPGGDGPALIQPRLSGAATRPPGSGPLPGLADLGTLLRGASSAPLAALPPGTVLVTELAADSGAPALAPGALAALGLGAVRDRAWATDGELAVRPVLTLGLRVSGGRAPGSLLARIAGHLGDPLGLALRR